MTLNSYKQISCFISKSFIYTCLLSIFFATLCTHINAQQAYLHGEYVSGGGVPEGSLIMLADGSEKPVEQVKAGDILAAYDPAIEQLVTTTVLNSQFHQNAYQPTVSVMLVIEELTASLQMNGGTLGILLKTSVDHPVLTQWGKKEAGRLQEGDKLYCYDDTTGRFHTFHVYGVSLDELPANNSYQLLTDKQNYIVNGTVVLDN